MSFTTHTINSIDGAKIGYRQIGHGPGLIICHGAGRISQNYEKLALALAANYTVYIPDRRGRGLRDEEGLNYNLQLAATDLNAVIKATGAELLFGHSAGGLIALQVQLTHSLIKIALYEPPVSINQSIPLNWLQDFETALHKGKRKEAMAISLKGLKAIEGIDTMPAWVVKVLINLIALLELKKEPGTRMLDLLPTLTADIKIAKQLDSNYHVFSDISIPVLLMHGTKSPAYFHYGINELAKILQTTETKVFEGFDHYSPEQKVAEISNELNRFFSTEA